MRVLGFHHGQLGDLFLNLPAIDHLVKTRGWQIDMPINKRYAQALPLFVNQRSLNSVVITDEYEHFPSVRDREVLGGRYDKTLNPMAPPRMQDWWRFMHQASRVLDDYNLGTLEPAQCQIHLTQWFDIESHRDTIALAAFAGFYAPNNTKRLSVEKAQSIVDALVARGWKVLQIGGADEPALNGATQFKGSYFESIRAILGCRLFIHTDTGAGWAVSGYQFPQIGLYSHDYYGTEHVKNIQPINPNGIYMSERRVDDICIHKLMENVCIMCGHANNTHYKEKRSENTVSD